MTARWQRMWELFIEPENVWADRYFWDAKKLRHLNENVWITQTLVERMLNGDTEEDWKRWQEELDGE